MPCPSQSNVGSGDAGSGFDFREGAVHDQALLFLRRLFQLQRFLLRLNPVGLLCGSRDQARCLDVRSSAFIAKMVAANVQSLEALETARLPTWTMEAATAPDPPKLKCRRGRARHYTARATSRAPWQS
ncbi:unnamed protein product [Symbiodinium natans]|uniref:Uncharacterized protein n=1 Tax=Symbiodinium natans TaxID=878477 RepID=A0A812PHU1_9DINO|nr:unnamed protein product [Symbiodinium natans]